MAAPPRSAIRSVLPVRASWSPSSTRSRSAAASAAWPRCASAVAKRRRWRSSFCKHIRSYPMTVWEFLGIDPGAGEEDIRRAYAQRLKTTRPDVDPAAFQQLRAAYEFALEQVRA